MYIHLHVRVLLDGNWIRVSNYSSSSYMYLVFQYVHYLAISYVISMHRKPRSREPSNKIVTCQSGLCNYNICTHTCKYVGTYTCRCMYIHTHGGVCSGGVCTHSSTTLIYCHHFLLCFHLQRRLVNVAEGTSHSIDMEGQQSIHCYVNLPPAK